jgi:hypothetical protein
MPPFAPFPTMQVLTPFPFAKEAIITQIFELFSQHHLSSLHVFDFLFPIHSSNVLIHVLIFLPKIFFRLPLFVFQILLRLLLKLFCFFFVPD